MKASKIRVIDFIDLLGSLVHIRVIDGSYENELLDYYTSVYYHQFDDIDEEILSREITEIKFSYEDHSIVINIGDHLDL